MPHYDTLNYYLEKLSPECLSDLRKKMVTCLIRGKQFNRERFCKEKGTAIYANHVEEVAGFI